MNIDDALLIHQTVETLTGSPGKTHAQLANACHVSQRRMTHLLFCLEKAGLVTTHPTGAVTLSDALAETVWRHADKLEYSVPDEQQGGPAYQGTWKQMMEAQEDYSTKSSERLQGVFNDLFGLKSPAFFLPPTTRKQK